MSRTVIVERKGSRLGRRKTITRSFEHELQPRQKAWLEMQKTKGAISTSNDQPKHSSLASETFKP